MKNIRDIWGTDPYHRNLGLKLHKNQVFGAMRLRIQFEYELKKKKTGKKKNVTNKVLKNNRKIFQWSHRVKK